MFAKFNIFVLSMLNEKHTFSGAHNINIIENKWYHCTLAIRRKQNNAKKYNNVKAMSTISSTVHAVVRVV